MIFEDKSKSENNWPELARQLLEKQKTSWELCRNNYEALGRIQTRKYEFEDFEIKLQLNPERITSSSADVGASAIKSRKCFLCLENLPLEQERLVYNKNFVILSNPYPIFQEHFTITKKHHLPQTIIGNFEEMLDITRALGNYYTVFYNGPKCGSSAPDHMHFQAVTMNEIPVEYEFCKMVEKLGPMVLKNGKIDIRFFEDHLRYFISFESQYKGELLFAFKTFVKAFKKISLPNDEPLMNIIANFQERSWRLIIFPRFKHRPHQFYADDESKLLISPAAVDMGGLLIIPRKEDFDKIKREDIISIYKQVTLPKEYFEYIRKKIGELFTK
jgi:ATP adenylyltransferase/5',5'''-P-1,P-4-tetraphosphate phosphorylase II